MIVSTIFKSEESLNRFVDLTGVKVISIETLPKKNTGLPVSDVLREAEIKLWFENKK